eukprot:6455584-Amphidinium_carterae.2
MRRSHLPCTDSAAAVLAEAAVDGGASKASACQRETKQGQSWFATQTQLPALPYARQSRSAFPKLIALKGARPCCFLKAQAKIGCNLPCLQACACTVVLRRHLWPCNVCSGRLAGVHEL